MKIKFANSLDNDKTPGTAATNIWQHVSRVAVSVVVLASLTACPAAPTRPVDDAPVQTAASGAIGMAAEKFNARDFPAALEAFERVARDRSASANDRRMAHLGKALVYLGNDEQLHSMDNAKLALLSAGQVESSPGQRFEAETDMLMAAVSSVIGFESKFEALQSKSKNADAQVARLGRDMEKLTQERDALLAEQENLHEALERLKQLTLGD